MSSRREESGSGRRTGAVALRTRSDRHYRLARRVDVLRDQFWIIPTILLVAGMVLAVLTDNAEELGVPRRFARGLPVGEIPSQTILGILATSMLSFVGVVFTITLVALQLASAQLSPRVIRTFTRSTLTKVAFGMFLATFSFSIVMLVLDESASDRDARSRAVTAASVMVLLSVVIFIAYVTSTMRLLQVSWVITAVAEETRATVRSNQPGRETWVDVERPVLDRRTARIIRLPLPTGRSPGSGRFGVVLGVNRARMVEIARRHDVVLEMLPRHGEYVASGGALVAVHGSGRPVGEELVDCFHLGRARSLYQDPAFGIRQLVDVAIQALSPALNQPATAVMVIDRLTDLLLRIGRAPLPTGLFVDADATVRLVEPIHTWDDFLDLAFVEILANGAESPQVTRRLRAAYDTLERELDPPLDAGLDRLRVALDRAVERHDDPEVEQIAGTPDALGLG
jgi:uncharacterized membrane protein